MIRSEEEILRQLGLGTSIASVCESFEMTRTEFDAWWKQCIQNRVPNQDGTTQAAVRESVDIERDEWGIPHIYAENDQDLFFGFGYAMAQDRLFQLDFLRRKGLGRLAEILGPEGLELDTIARTVGLNRIALAEWDRLPEETQNVLTAFSAGINAWMEQTRDTLPIEFSLLDYQPEAWSPIDSLAIETEFRWYLTGRFPVIVIPELAKRILGTGSLWREFSLGEADDESIMPPGSYSASQSGTEAVGHSMSEPDEGIGSNNWSVGGQFSADGKPLLASDPHIAFEAVSCWYEVHLCGGSYNVAGMAYAGMPAVMVGRNENVAWGITNNICSQRDLYQEQTDPEHPNSFLYDGQWEPARELEEVIRVHDAEPVTRTIRFSRNGPIVDEILPPPGNETGSVSLKWLGAYQGGWLTALLGMDRSNDVEEFREALRPWHVPTFSLVFADVAGRIGFQSSGRIPIRKQEERGYRPGWDPEHQWQGLIPFESMPGVIDPERGWMGTANNRLAPDDFPYLLFGRWSSGHRAERIRNMIEGSEQLTRKNFCDMQHDTLSLRAVRCIPPLIETLNACDDERIRSAVRILKDWDCRSEADHPGPSLFNVFFIKWAQTVADEHFDEPAAALLAKGAEGVAARMLVDDQIEWFQNGDRDQKIISAFNDALDVLTERLGPKMSDWQWGKLHQMPLKHVLSSRGDLGTLLDHGGGPMKGDMTTVCNTGCGPDWEAPSGGGYRMVVELSSSPPALWAVDVQSQSGHPGSPHYSDQFADWAEGTYHQISLDREKASQSTRQKQILNPQ
ncbi:MAG: penicillin acylase family protein [Planctomycetes bacterium]|nr:penicillin acylase family protein [Planctomycetota bacterium]